MQWHTKEIVAQEFTMALICLSNSNGLISVNSTLGLPNYIYTLYSTILDVEQISLSHFAHFLLVKM